VQLKTACVLVPAKNIRRFSHAPYGAPRLVIGLSNPATGLTVARGG
jgi:hypothetical protein